ncbi:MAG: Hpt domain-containing protein [Pseudomonadota bacterium]
MTAPTNAKILDLEHLNRVTFGDAALKGEILKMFRDQARALQNDLSTEMDLEARQRLAHTLKGSARGIGANAIGEIAELIEISALPAAAYAEALKRLDTVIQETEISIETEIGINPN